MPGSASPGRYVLEVEAECPTPLGPVSDSAHLEVLVEPSPSPGLGVRVRPPMAVVEPGGSAEFRVDVVPLGGFSGSVSVSVETPDWATASVSGGGTPPLTARVRVDVSEDAPEGRHSVEITVSGGGVSESVEADLLVLPGPRPGPPAGAQRAPEQAPEPGPGQPEQPPGGQPVPPIQPAPAESEGPQPPAQEWQPEERRPEEGWPSEIPWPAVGLALLAVLLIVTGVLLLRRRSGA